MTREQRRERDFWLGCAERAYAAMFDAGAFPFLCPKARCEGYTERLELFRPNGDAYVWWNDTGDGPDVVDGLEPASGRVLAACFLAAMAELGE